MIYLDHAATSFPKPDGVVAAVTRWYEELGVSAGRGEGPATRTVLRAVEDTRQRLAKLFGVPTHRLVFTSGATDSLNTFLSGFLRPGDRVLTTALEHSSLVRPLVHLQATADVSLEVLAPDAQGGIAVEQFAEALARDSFRLVAFTHASNVVGTVLDASKICATAREHGAATLIDASQTAGILDVDVGADAIVASAHKSLLGPPGLGTLAVHPDLALPPARRGGTGSSQALDAQPEEWPTAMESGTPNTPAILGLAAALDYLEDHDLAQLLERELALTDQLRAGLPKNAICYGPVDGPRVPVLSFNLPDADPAEIGMLLSASGIHVRTGHHCAPWIHDHLGTEVAGTVRASFGPFSTTDDVAALTTALGA